MSGSFVAEVGGSPSAVRGAAEWLRHGVEASAESVREGSASLFAGVPGWDGDAAAAFTDVSIVVADAAQEIKDVAGPFAETLHVFAGRLERMQEHFEGLLSHAAEIGLAVTGTTVFAPEWGRTAVPQSRDDEAFEDWIVFTDRRRDYERMQRDVVEWHGDHGAWIMGNLVAFIQGVPQASAAAAILSGLRQGEEIGGDMGEVLLDRAWEVRIEDLRYSATNWREAADETVRLSVASGDPSLRSLLRERIADGLPEAFHGKAAAAETVADLVRVSRRIVPVVGTAVDVGMGVWDIAAGSQPVDVAVDAGADIVGSAVGGIIGVAAGVGIVGVAGFAAAGGLVVGGVISSTWGATPPSWREGIYSWTEDGFIIVGDIGEEVGDWFVDRWMDLTGGVPQ